MKNGNLYQEVKSAQKDEKIAWSKKSEIELAMEKELEEVIKPIKEKYEPILKAMENDASKKSEKLFHLAGIYHDYSSFSTGMIANAFAVLLSYVEGEKYIHYRNYANRNINEASIIIKENVNNNLYNMIDYDILDRLYNNGDLIRLDSGFGSIVDFYDYVGQPNYYFGKFNYLYEFVNRLINYRIDNNIKYKITEEELYSFMCNFISTHPDLVQKNKEKREKMLMEQVKEKTLISQFKKLELKFKN